jgi:hypothetical protein
VVLSVDVKSHGRVLKVVWTQDEAVAAAYRVDADRVAEEPRMLLDLCFALGLDYV